MKNFVKVSVMALVAMFAFSTVADAQKVSINLNKAAKLFGKSKKQKEAEKAGSAISQSVDAAAPEATALAAAPAAAKSAAPAAAVAAGGMKTYSCKGFSMEYPDVYIISEEECDDATFKANIVKYVTDLYLSYSHFTHNTEEMKEFFQNKKNMYEGDSENWHFEAPVISAKISTMRGTGDCEMDGVDGTVKIVKMYFVVNQGETSFRGWMNYPQADEAKMKSAFEKMIASLKAID